MKTLLTESIRVTGLSMGNRVITAFNDPDQELRSSQKYFDLAELCGTATKISFQYNEDGLVNRSFCIANVPKGLTEFEVRDLIELEIQEKLKA